MNKEDLVQQVSADLESTDFADKVYALLFTSLRALLSCTGASDTAITEGLDNISKRVSDEKSTVQDALNATSEELQRLVASVQQESSKA